MTERYPGLLGKVAIVTGGAAGIGRSISEHLSAAGCRVAILDSDGAGANAAAETLGDAMAVTLDVADAAGWNAAVTKVSGHFGGIDLLVNNAGMSCPGSIDSLEVQTWQRSLDVNLTGVYLGCRTVLPAMSPGGSIVNVGSGYGVVPDPDFVGYNVAKAGVVMLTKSVALHCARNGSGIRCNCVCPGVVSTSLFEASIARTGDPDRRRGELEAMHPMGRLGAPAEVAETVLFLLSTAASFTTGAIVPADGGLTI